MTKKISYHEGRDDLIKDQQGLPVKTNKQTICFASKFPCVPIFTVKTLACFPPYSTLTSSSMIIPNHVVIIFTLALVIGKQTLNIC